MEFLQKHKKILLSVLAILILVIYFLPVYWMYISGFKPEKELFSSTPTFWPHYFTLQPLRSVFKAHGLRYLKNSFLIATSTTIFTMIIASLAAYAFARLKVRWVQWLLLFFLVAQMLPPVLMATPLFIIFQRMGLINTYLAVILANSTLSLPFAVIMLRTVFLQVPEELEEASRIDGCNRIKSLFYITFPVAKSGLVVVAVISFIFAFGDFIYSLSFLNKEAMQPATLGLYNFMGAQDIRWNSIMSYASITVLPLILIFIFLQKEIVKGLSSGAFK